MPSSHSATVTALAVAIGFRDGAGGSLFALSVVLAAVKAIVLKEHNCIPDEHCVQTLLAMLGLENELERRTLTYTLWNASVSGMGRQGWHPITFKYTDIDLQHIQQIKVVDHVYYETEYRTEWCQINSTLSPHFLFARKFSKGAAMRILVEGVLGDFDPASLLSS